MKKMQIILMAVLLAAGAGYSALFTMDFEGQTVGTNPAAPAVVRPVNSLRTVDNQVTVVSTTTMGTGQGVRLLDNGAVGSQLEYNFVAASNAQVSAISYTFSYAQTAMANTNGAVTVSIGKYNTDTAGTTLNSTARNVFRMDLKGDGWVAIASNNSAKAIGQYAQSTAHTVAIYANDYDTQQVKYTILGTDYTVNGNSADVWIDGALVGQGMSFYLGMTNDLGGVLNVGNTTNNLGRIGFVSSSSAIGSDFQLDNLVVNEIPEPATMGMLLLGAVTVLAVRRRRA